MTDMAETTELETTAGDGQDAQASAPCDVPQPRAGCCGQGKAWIWYPSQRRWMCVPRAGCP